MIDRSRLVPIERLAASARLTRAASEAAREALEAHHREYAEELRGFLVWGRAAMLAHGDLRRVWHEAPDALRRAWASANEHGNCQKIRAAVTLVACARQHRAAAAGSPCGACPVGRENARALSLPYRPEPPA